MKGSIVIPCFNSHEAIRRQILWFDSWIRPFSNRWNLVIVDDGSNPPISSVPPTNFNVSVIRIPPHEEKWTQPRARNLGARSCPESEFIFFADVDHILTPEALASANSFDGDMLKFPRKTGALDENGKLLTNKEDLLRFGATLEELTPRSEVPISTCLIRRTVHLAIGGFKEILERHGRNDLDYRRKYEEHALSGKCGPPEISPSKIYVFPNPNANRQGLFHSLKRRSK